MKITNLSDVKPKWEETPDGFLRCRARVLAERVMPYAAAELSGLGIAGHGGIVNMFVGAEDMFNPEALRSLEGSPVVSGDHYWLTPGEVQAHSVGSVAGTPSFEYPYIVCDLLITDPLAIAEVKAGKLPEISAAYHSEVLPESGTFEDMEYDARQKDLRFNHIAILPPGLGRAGRDVRILNKKKEEKIMFKVKLVNTGKYIQVENEDDAKAVEAEGEASTASVEKTMGDLEAKTGELSALQAEVDDLKGQLQVYKEKLDQLLSEEAVEHAASEIVADGESASEIVENSIIMNEKGEEADEEKKKEFMNSLRPLRKEKLHAAVLNAVGVKTEGMSAEALRGAFNAQRQICNSMKGRKVVAGHRILNSGAHLTTENQQIKERTPLQRLGFEQK